MFVVHQSRNLNESKLLYIQIYVYKVTWFLLLCDKSEFPTINLYFVIDIVVLAIPLNHNAFLQPLN